MSTEYGGRGEVLVAATAAVWEPAAVRLRLSDLVEAAARDILSLGCEVVTSSDSGRIRAGRERALARGVRIRAVHPDTTRGRADAMRDLRTQAERGVQVRTMAALPFPIAVFDGRTAVLPVDPADHARGAVELRDRTLVAALWSLGDLIWDGATPLSPVARHSAAGLSPKESAILGLAGQGLTDEATARRLGVSLRTVRRTMAELMERLNASSRFQAGAQARELGWIGEAERAST